jgi:crossover junction endonuclease MUS81
MKQSSIVFDGFIQ